MKQGQGTLIVPDYKVYVGLFDKNVKHGIGYEILL